MLLRRLRRMFPDLPDRRMDQRHQEALPRNIRRPYRQAESACRQAVLKLGNRGCCFRHVRKLAEVLAWALDYKPEYLHGGHLIDRVGYKEFVKHIFEGVEFNPEAKMADDIYWAENEQRGNMHVMPISQHKHAGPAETANYTFTQK